MTRKAGRAKKAKPALRAPKRKSELEDRGEIAGLAGEVASHRETGPVLTGGDVDANWQRAHDSGDEAVGGSVATPDQDVVDEIGRALGVPQGPEAEVRASEEILHDRDRFRWHLERDAEDTEEGRVTGHRRTSS